MNILIISFSTNGALGDGLKVIVNSLSKYAKIHLLTNTNISCSNVESICQIRFDRKHPLDFINPISYHRIRKYVKGITYDVAFIYTFHPINLFIYYIIDNNKIIPYVHDHILHSGVKKFDKFFLKRIYDKYYNDSRKIVVSCNYIKNDIINKKLFSRIDDIEVVYLGLLDNFIFPVTEESDNDIDVLFFGRIEYYKALDVLVEVARKMSKYSFKIIGKGSLLDIFNINELPPNCEHINRYVPDEELAKYIQRSKVFVLPYRDATGTQTIQSIYYYSKPIVATNVGCFPEYITDGLDGVIVEPNNVDSLYNGLTHILGDSNKAKLMGTEGRKKIDTIFSNKEIASHYLKIFKSIQ